MSTAMPIINISESGISSPINIVVTGDSAVCLPALDDNVSCHTDSSEPIQVITASDVPDEQEEEPSYSYFKTSESEATNICIDNDTATTVMRSVTFPTTTISIISGGSKAQLEYTSMSLITSNFCSSSSSSTAHQAITFSPSLNTMQPPNTVCASIKVNSRSPTAKSANKDNLSDKQNHGLTSVYMEGELHLLFNDN